jgi:predicted permease
VVPAVRTARADIARSCHGDARSLRLTRESTRWSRALIAAQVALSVVLLAGATLLLATLRNIQAFHPGFVADGVVLLNVDPARAGYAGDRLGQYYRDLLDAVRTQPGVAAASLSKITPISGAGIDRPIAVDGRPRERDAMVVANRMSEGFFATMSIPLLLGRDFVHEDGVRPGGAVIVNQALARRFFGSVDPIGRHLAIAGGPPLEIVGLVANSKYGTLREGDVPTLYLYMGDPDPGGMTLSVRATTSDPLALAATIRERVRSIAGNVPVSQPRTLASQVERSIAAERLIARLLSGFAVLALVLAAVGLYGTLGYTVARRTSEIGLRLALGATRGEVLRSVLRQSCTLVVTGLAVGLPATLLLSKPLAGLLYGVAPSDPRVLAGAGACLLLVGLAAAAVPALRAARVDPLVALRHE